MRHVKLLLLAAIAGSSSMSVSFAAGNGAGAGGSGHQRAINSGLPPGEVGPLGSVNNPHRTTPAQPEAGMHGSPRPEPASDQTK